MRYVILVSVICCNIYSVYGYPRPDPVGVGAYSYQDSAGNRYGGTYGLNDADLSRTGNGFNDGVPGFFPEYFRNLQSLLQEVFNDVRNQNLAFDAAKKAYDITSNQPSNHVGFAPNFATFADQGPNFSDFGALPGFNMAQFGFGNMPGFNSAYASGVVTPDFQHQVAQINPQNPVISSFSAAHPLTALTDFMGGPSFHWHNPSSQHASNIHLPNAPNVNVMNRFADNAPNDGQPHFNSVSSSSYSTSTNVNGKQHNQRGAETVVNKDGKVTSYRVQN